MIRLHDEPPALAVIEQLAAWQSEIDEIPEYSTRVKRGMDAFKSRNKLDDPTFREIRAALRAMCGGAERCYYCEDSLAYQIDHVRPKHVYPDYVFQWPNYLPSCGNCNIKKGTQFAIVDEGRYEPIRRSDGPPIGPMAWIDPRVEDPLDYFWLDFDTFMISARIDRPDPRADFMLYAFRNVINEEPLLEKRSTAFKDYSRAVKEYVESESKLHRNGVRDEIRRRDHPTVWQSMQRRHAERPELLTLFAAAPEALVW